MTVVLLLAWLLCGLAIASGAAGAEKATIMINLQERHQRIEGFGASGAWWHTWVGNYPQEKQDELLDLLFTDRGAALTIFRYNIPAGGGSEIQRPERKTATIETAPGQFDLSADSNALEILRGVRKRGVERFVLFANSPPARLTRNGMTSGGENGGSNLRPGADEDFATYLIDCALRIRDAYDLPHVSLSPINEPQWKWGEKWRGQEGCHYTPAEAAALLRKVVEQAERRKTGLRIEAPESGAWKGLMDYCEAMFTDPVINAHIEEVAVHSYWSDRAAKEEVAAAFRQRFPNKRLAMTEYCEMRHGHDLSIEGGLHLAQVMHDDLTIGNVVSWQWWLGVAAGGYRDGLIYAHPETQVIEPTKRLWVMGQISRFIRPGFVRIGAQPSDPRISVTAFVSPDDRRVVVVAINPTDESVPLDPNAIVADRNPASVYVTDATRDLAALEDVGDEFSLPAQSLSTFIFDR